VRSGLPPMVAPVGVPRVSEWLGGLFGPSTDTICTVCLDNPRVIKFMPCRHFLTCAKCYDQLQKHHEEEKAQGRQQSERPVCPVCRSEIHFAGTEMEVKKWAEMKFT